MAIVRSYSKAELQIVLYNPHIDVRKNPDWIKERKMSRPTFGRLVYPIIETDCKKIISLREFKRIRIVPANVVEVIFKKLEI